jgi:hypothetical protein
MTCSCNRHACCLAASLGLAVARTGPNMGIFFLEIRTMSRETFWFKIDTPVSLGLALGPRGH